MTLTDDQRIASAQRTMDAYGRIRDAYTVYVRDRRAYGIDALDAFLEAVWPLLTPAPPYVPVAPHCDPAEAWT